MGALSWRSSRPPRFKSWLGLHIFAAAFRTQTYVLVVPIPTVVPLARPAAMESLGTVVRVRVRLSNRLSLFRRLAMPCGSRGGA